MLDRRRAAFCPQAGKSLAGQVIQDPLDHRRVFDTRDDLDRSSTIRTGLHIYLEHALEALRPSHRRALLGWDYHSGTGTEGTAILEQALDE